MEISIATAISDIQSTLANRRVANAQIGYGSVLILDFEDPGRGVAGNGKPDAYLLIQCVWRIELADEVLTASEDSRDRLRECVKALNGRAVLRIAIDTPGLDLRLFLDGDCRIVAFPIHAENTERENWTIRMPNNMALVAGPGRGVRWERADE